MAELLIGRRGQGSPPACFATLAEAAGARRGWSSVGWLNITAVFLILTFYSVIAGWALAYLPRIAGGSIGTTAAEVSDAFGRLLASPGEMTFWHGAFMLVTAFIVGRGLRGGIESAVKLMMPTLFVLLLVLVGYAAVAGDFNAATKFLFSVDFSRVDANVVLAAVGQAFFSVSVAMGLLIAYGRHLPKGIRIPQAALIIAGADTIVALLAGLAIFPIVFGNGLDPAEGPGLIFVTLPLAFEQMPGGALFGTVFFALLILAALTSSIAIVQPLVLRVRETGRFGRNQAAFLICAAAWVIGLATVFSFNVWSDVRPLGFLALFADKTIFDLIDYLASNIMLPLGGIAIAVFVGWIMRRDDTRDELALPDAAMYRSWRWLVRYLVPLAVSAVLISNVV